MAITTGKINDFFESFDYSLDFVCNNPNSILKKIQVASLLM